MGEDNATGVRRRCKDGERRGEKERKEKVRA